MVVLLIVQSPNLTCQSIDRACAFQILANFKQCPWESLLSSAGPLPVHDINRKFHIEGSPGMEAGGLASLFMNV